MAENMIKFLRGNVASLPQTATEGAVYFTKDEGLYLGLADGTYHRYGDFITVANVASLPSTGAHETCMYYCEAENILAKWDGAEWVQINKQKTLEQLGGVAKSVYEAKVALLEKADTDNATAIAELESYVGTIPTDEKYAGIDNVVSYVNKKAEETLAAAQGGSSETAASVKQQLDNYKSENDTKVNANTEAVAEIKADYLKKADKDALQANIDAKAAQTDLEAAEDRITALENANKDGGAVAAAIAEAKKAGTDAQAAADAAQGDVDALAGKVGTVPADKTIVQMIADAQAAATYDDTVLAGRVTDAEKAIDGIEADYLKAADKTELANAVAAEKERAEGIEGGLRTDVDAIKGDYLKAADKEALQTQINTIMNNPDAEGAINSINEFTKYVKDHGEIAEGFRTDINKNKEDIAAIAEDYLVEADKTALQGSIDGVAGRMTTAEGEIDALQADSHTHGNKGVLDGITAEKVSAWDAAEGNAEAYADGLDEAMDTRVKVVEGKAHEHANKALLDTYTQTEANLADAVSKKHEHANATELAKIADGDVAKWNGAQAAAEATAAAALSAAKTELEGKITAEATAARAAEKANADAIDLVEGRLDTLEAIDHEAYKGYADQAEADAVATAKAYTESLLTWGSF